MDPDTVPRKLRSGLTAPEQAGRRARRRGSAAIEAALTLTLFMGVTLSMIDFGLSLFLHQSFVSQARAGARYGAIHPGNLAAIKNMVLYNRTTGSGSGIMGLSPTAVSVRRDGTPGTENDRIVVTISGYNFTWVTPGYAGKKTGKPIVVVIPVEN